MHRESLWSVKGKRLPRTIRFRLLMTVNAAVTVLVAAFLIVDYRREITDRLVQKRISLEEEAKTILPAVLRLQSSGHDAIQQYLDSVCGRMRDAESPGHHIAIRMGETLFQSTAHGRNSAEIVRAMERAGGSEDQHIPFRKQELIIGSARLGEMAAYVSEDVRAVRRSVLEQVLWRLLGIATLGLVAAAVASGVLWRAIIKPLNRLVATVRQIGGGNLAVRTGPFNSAELTLLSGAVNSLVESLEASEISRRRELTKAREIQEHLLPRTVEVPGLDLATLYRPATTVAGDYYDVLSLPDGTWLLCIADVCGHGIPAAMGAAMLKAFLLHAIEHHTSPDHILAFVNKRFSAVLPPGMFASMILVRHTSDAGCLEYASAGHEPVWRISPGGELRRLEATGLPLGIDVDATWKTGTAEISLGDKLLLLTDGVSETFNSHKEIFGRKRLAGLISESADAPVDELLRRIDHALSVYRGEESLSDDVTLVAAEFVGLRLPHSPSPSQRPSHCPTA